MRTDGQIHFPRTNINTRFSVMYHQEQYSKTIPGHPI